MRAIVAFLFAPYHPLGWYFRAIGWLCVWADTVPAVRRASFRVGGWLEGLCDGQ